ncbi:hypothetical protein A0H81_07731 [Grifola frondosa]|uniref:Uncharacterized protein n=1 Tax=Grifola frondosa TaxID=5627 RepID=A0A1C7M660_GRIFR|nr:hypothetical protein A0H81_07731 [Grifola frondosa]
MCYLSAESLRALADIRGEVQPSLENPHLSNSSNNVQDYPMEEDMAGIQDLDWETVPEDLQVNTMFIYALRDIQGSRDMQMWRQRIRNMDENWHPLLPNITDAYIYWRYNSKNPSPHPSDPSDDSFTINMIDFYTVDTTATITQTVDITSTAEALILNGYLGSTPISPTLAISLSTLELFAIANVFDVYLTILHNVMNQVFHALGHSTPNWRILNACPACNYELEGKTPSMFSRMYCINGNNSLKWLAPLGNRKVGDMRIFAESNYYLLNNSQMRSGQEDHKPRS